VEASERRRPGGINALKEGKRLVGLDAREREGGENGRVRSQLAPRDRAVILLVAVQSRDSGVVKGREVNPRKIILHLGADGLHRGKCVGRRGPEPGLGR
jgi:hypothetical protein